MHIQEQSPKLHPLSNISQSTLPASWIEIDSAALHHNIALYKSWCAPAALAAVIKSNAYGHGLIPIAQILEKNSDISLLCIASAQEALMLRAAGITKPLLVLSIIDAPLEHLIEQSIAFVIYDELMVQHANACAAQLGKKAFVHIKVDTGLSRLGFTLDHAFEHIYSIIKLPHIVIQGIFSHLADSEQEDQSFVDLQTQRFETLLDQLRNCGFNPQFCHIACSAAISANSKTHRQMVRLGIGMYGLWPSPENKQMTTEKFPSATLLPALSWKTRIIQIKEIHPLEYVGYDRTFQAISTMKIAVIPIGYWDGFDRKFSNNGFVYIHGVKVPVIGRVAMNLTMIDVSTCNANIGDEVVILGNYPDIGADDLARRCSTINYEIVTRINPLLQRIVI